MDNLVSALIKAGSPVFASLVGGPVASIGMAVIGALADALGTSTNADVLADAVSKNPEKVKELEAAKAATFVEELNLRLKDVQDARATTLNLVKEGSSIAWGAPLVSILIVLLFAVVLIIFITKPIALTETQSTLLNILLGALTVNFTQVVNYWLGSSHGSASKDAAIKSIAATK